MKLLGFKHLVITLAACLAVTMVGCGDDDDTTDVDAGYDAGAAGTGTAGTAGDSGAAGTGATDSGVDSSVDDGGGEDAGEADAG